MEEREFGEVKGKTIFFQGILYFHTKFIVEL